jgi:beta-glucanase (GH16 family)
MPWPYDEEEYLDASDPNAESILPESGTNTNTIAQKNESFFGNIGSFFGSKETVNTLLNTGLNFGIGALTQSQKEKAAQAEFERQKQLLELKQKNNSISTTDYNAQLAQLMASLNAQRAQPSSSNTPLIIGGIVGGVVLISVVLIVVTRK